MSPIITDNIRNATLSDGKHDQLPRTADQAPKSETKVSSAQLIAENSFLYENEIDCATSTQGLDIWVKD